MNVGWTASKHAKCLVNVASARGDRRSESSVGSITVDWLDDRSSKPKAVRMFFDGFGLGNLGEFWELHAEAARFWVG